MDTTNNPTPKWTLGPCEKCGGPEICCFAGQRNICGDCRQAEATAAGLGGHPQWACN